MLQVYTTVQGENNMWAADEPRNGLRVLRILRVENVGENRAIGDS